LLLSKVVPCASDGGAGLDCCNPLAKGKADRFEPKVQFAFRNGSLMRECGCRHRFCLPREAGRKRPSLEKPAAE
jgi:hypothetical protein